jgi:hypothetical protein
MSRRRHPRGGLLAALLLGLVALAGCASAAGGAALTSTPQPAPTVAPIFSSAQPTMLPTPEPLRTERPIPTPDPTERTAGRTGIAELRVYDDRLAAGWSLERSSGVRYRASSAYVHSGASALAAEPRGGTATLFFTVDEDAPATYERDRVLGVSFWINGGPEGIADDDFAVTVVGSNAHTHWVPNDTSVRLDGRNTSGESFLFSETRLYYLGINRDIPPETWVEVVLWLDEREFDPDYAYVTGFYVKNDVKYQAPFYIDRVSLLVQE